MGTLTQRFYGGQRVRNQSLARMRQWVIHYNNKYNLQQQM